MKEFEHFKKRLKERYGFDISRKEYDKLCANPWITSIHAVEKQKGDTQLLVCVKIDKWVDTPIYATYSFKRKCFTTANPKPKHWSLIDL